MTLRTILAAILMTFVTLGEAAAQAPCILHRFVSLDMRTNPDGSVTVPVGLDDHTANFIVDTGAVYSLAGSDIVDGFGMRASPFPGHMDMPGGVVVDHIAYMDRFSLGPMGTSGRVGLMIVPSPTLGFGADGLLGANVLSNYDVELDFYGGKFNLFDADNRCPGMAVYWTRGAYAKVPISLDSNLHISIPVLVDGKPVTALVDTGAGLTIMGLSLAHDLGIDEKNPAVKQLGELDLNAGKPAQAMRYPFATLTFAGVVVNNPDITIVQDDALVRGIPKLTLGIDVLRQLHLYIAYKEQMLYVTPAQAH